MRKKDAVLSEGWGQIVPTLLVDTTGGKQKLNCANAEGVVRYHCSELLTSFGMAKTMTQQILTLANVERELDLTQALY